MWFKKSYGSTNETSSCVVEPKVWRANSSDSTLFSSLFVFAGELDLDEPLEKHFDDDLRLIDGTERPVGLSTDPMMGSNEALFSAAAALFNPKLLWTRFSEMTMYPTLLVGTGELALEEALDEDADETLLEALKFLWAKSSESIMYPTLLAETGELSLDEALDEPLEDGLDPDDGTERLVW